MQIKSGAAAAVGEALFAVAFVEEEEAGAVDGHDEVSKQAKGIEGLHPDEPADTPSSELGEGAGADMAQKVVEGFVHGQRVLLGASQAIGIVEYLQLGIAQLVVQLAAAP